jgi:hypothetical protein
MRWKPIDTAPKDGRKFIAYTSYGDMLFTAHWNKEAEQWYTDYERWGGRMTHWMSLPKPPPEPPS